MKLKNILKVISITAFVVFTQASYADLSGTGASFPYPVYKEWISNYYKATDKKVNYTATGSGAGVKAIVAKSVDFAGTDKPIKQSNLKKSKLNMFPTVVGAIVLSYNLPGAKGLKLSEKAIEGIFLGTITKWNDTLIAKTNPKVKLPDKKILLVHRSDSSGTTFNFTYYLSQISKSWKKKFGAKKTVVWASKNRIAGKGNFGVSHAIKNNNFSIGYVDYADAKSNKLSIAAIENKAGKYVSASLKNIEDAVAKADLDPAKDFYAIIGYPPTGYPIIAATFILFPADNLEQGQKVVDFFKYAFKQGDGVVNKLGYIPLPATVKAKIQTYWEQKGFK